MSSLFAADYKTKVKTEIGEESWKDARKQVGDKILKRDNHSTVRNSLYGRVTSWNGSRVVKTHFVI
jgi:hypothetical protein